MTNPSRRLRVAALVLITLWASSPGPAPAFGQNVAPAPAAPRQPRAQAIDPLTASIEGRVTTADSGAAIRRAEVRAMSANGINRLATTDGEGRFQLRDLPAGEYRITVSKSGFVPLTYGQRRPFEASRPIELREGQHATANMTLPRAAAITGRVYDESGEPIADVPVQALRLRTAEGRRRLEPVGAADRSDDTGSFRLYGLPPGSDYVTATAPRRQETAAMGGPALRSPNAPGRPLTVIFYPGTASPSDAVPLTVGAGGEVRADMQIADAQAGAATVSGAVFTSAGAPAVDATVTLRSTAMVIGASLAAGPPPLMFSGHTNPDGTFAIAGVPPGAYALTATLRLLPPGMTMVRTTTGDAAVVDPSTGSLTPLAIAMRPETAAIPLTVTADVAGVSITTRTPATVEGSFVADAGVTQALPERLGVTVASELGSESMMQFGGGRTFRLAGLSGLATITVQGLPDGWMVKSIIVDGTDRTDEPLDFRNGGESDVRIVLTDRITALTGTVGDGVPSRDDARRDYTVVVFPDDATKWTYPSRYVRSARTGEQGTFRITGLPPERYLAVAVDFVEDGEWTDPEFLERIRPDATSFSLAEAENRTLDVRLLRR